MSEPYRRKEVIGDAVLYLAHAAPDFFAERPAAKPSQEAML